MKKVSIKDVARHAGVSPATVSYVSNNTKQISPETTERVRESIRILGYKPNSIARSFKTGKKQLIAFVVPDIANAFFATLIEEVETVLASEGYKLIIQNTKETKKRELDNINVASSGLVDGFIIASTLKDYHELNNVLPPSMPAIFIDRILPNCPNDSISVNCYDATCEGITHLINKGDKKIGYITGLAHISTTKERLLAYETTMKAHDLYDEKLIHIGNSMSHCVNQHLTSLLEYGCTAIVIANNIMATEAMIQMIESGISPGKDINLLGFKDSNQAQYGLQYMNLVCQPTAELGRLAGERMLERLADSSIPVRHDVLNARFIPSSY